jgi:MFS superfamily sulfate permease-like transporter
MDHIYARTNVKVHRRISSRISFDDTIEDNKQYLERENVEQGLTFRYSSKLTFPALHAFNHRRTREKLNSRNVNVLRAFNLVHEQSQALSYLLEIFSIIILH